MPSTLARAAASQQVKSARCRPFIIALAAVGSLLTSNAYADLRLEGRFQGRGDGRLELQVLVVDRDDENSAYLVIADTAILNQCTGEVRGTARKLDASTLRLRVKADDPNEFCEITVRYNGERSRVQITSENCDHFHGPSCDFGGTLKRR
ncbi:hypothetical protein [Methylobacterium sp. Leaf93]|uniref:hypothetical protein n=1 Tax=Methylobacterium sp. Leaf93 TaxID=1736249 RepID=UPI0006FCFFCA|nr:hypothetical protein [Methylobacterium sp. Leaf93]KQP02589.1 hypothetical protein ASF26_14205 [Methylobacterium sp. Leaf93]